MATRTKDLDAKEQKQLEINDADMQYVEEATPVAAAIVPVSPNPMLMIQRAVELDLDIEKLERLLALQERWEANEAKKAFVEAMAAFKKEDIHVTQDKVNKQYNSRYTSLGNLVSEVTPYLSKHGLSAYWEIDQANGIKVTCIMTHRLGHSKPTSITFPPDKSGSKNPLQEIKSSITYGKISTFESACGIASSDANVSDDANGAAGSKETLPEHSRQDWVLYIRESGDLVQLRARWKEADGKAKAINDGASRTLFEDVKNECKEKLENRGAR